jgi:CheY-like chemotaxis protein
MSDTSLETILIIDDNSDYRKLIKTFIGKLLPGVETIEYDPVFEGAPADDFNWSAIDVLLLDYHLSIVGTTGLDILHKHHKKPAFPATIMLTGAGTEEIAIRALKSGIFEYQPKQSLTKDKLKQSIIHAWEDKKSERKKRQEITQHNKSFSKEVFYENLEQTFDQKGIERALVVIKPDNINELEEQIGIIGRDNLVNHIGKNSFEVFKLGACNPNITKISDTAIAVQIDYPVNQETLEFNMQGLCKHLAKCTFKFSEEKYKYSISIGVLKLGIFNEAAEQLIHIASTACKHASEFEGNSYYIWKDTDKIPELSKPDEVSNEQLPKDEIAIKAKEEREKLETELKAAAAAKEKSEAVVQVEQEAKKKLEAELRVAEEAKEKAEAALKAAEEAKEKAEVEAKIRAEQEAKEKAEAELRAATEAREKAETEAKIRAEQEAKEKAEAELRAATEAKEKAETEAKIRAEQEAKEKAEAELRAATEAKEKAETEAKIRAEQEAKEKAEAELRTATEAKEKAETEAKIRAEQEAKEKAEAELRAATEAKQKAETEAKIRAEQEAKEKAEAELKAITDANAKVEAEMRAEQEAKQRMEAELKAESEAKAKAEAEIRAEQEAKQRMEAELKAESEAKAKAEAEVEMKAAKEAKEKLEAELKAVVEAKAKAEAEMKVAKEAKEKLEAELKAVVEAKTKNELNQAKESITPSLDQKITNNETENVSSASVATDDIHAGDQAPADNTQDQNIDSENIESLRISIQETETQIRKLIDEKRIIQTYQPVIAMFDNTEDETKEIYKIGLQAIIEDDDINKHLSDTSIFSISLQQTISEWILRQVFLRITESGTTECQNHFLISVTEAWFSDITLFNWLQNILSQTKKYSPGKSIILDVPLDIFNKHQKRAQALINSLHKSHHFSVALSNIDTFENISTNCSQTSSTLLMMDIEQLQQLSEILAPADNEEINETSEKQNLLQYLKSNEIRIITAGIEDSTLLTDAITAGTDYAIGSFVGEVQDNLVESGTVESFELT